MLWSNNCILRKEGILSGHLHGTCTNHMDLIYSKYVTGYLHCHYNGQFARQTKKVLKTIKKAVLRYVEI